MNVSLARESPGDWPRATLRCTGRYEVEATADVLSQADMELGTKSASRRPCQTLSWELAELNPPGEKATGILVEHRHEAKECNGLNQSSSKNTESHPWAVRWLFSGASMIPRMGRENRTQLQFCIPL